MDITIKVDQGTLKEIESQFGDCSKDTVQGVVENIMERYLTPEYISYL